MSIHPSLSSSSKSSKTRSVLKRAERLKILMEKGSWQEGQNIFGLPKTKILRIKIKKEKAAPAATTGEAEVEATPTEETKAAPAAEKPAKPSSH